MALPNGTFTRAKWLAFFAELTAKLTHHNVVVSMEGCETVKRLLISQVSIVAFLQQGDLLAALLDTFVGGIRSERLFSASVALDLELSMAQLQTLSLCVEMMTALHADGDRYYTLLVLARAGTLVQGLLEVLQRAPPHVGGLVANVLSSLLSLPLGRDPSPALVAEMAEAASASPSSAHAPSVALRRHVQELADLVRTHATLLQDAADTLTAIVATTTGAQRFAALRLLNMAYKRLKKHRLRQRRQRSEVPTRFGSSSCGGAEELGGRAAPMVQSSAGTTDTVVVDDEAALYADFDVTITGAPDAAAAGATEMEREEQGGGEAHDSDTEGRRPSNSRGRPLTEPTRAEAEGSTLDGEHDVSDLVDQEPAEVKYEVPTELVHSVFQSVAECKSHDDFFTSMNDLWALTVADGKAVAALFDVAAFQPFHRFLTIPPATRQDRVLFTELLLWLGHVMASQMLLPATVRALLDVVGSSFLPMLLTDLTQAQRGEGRVASRAAPFDGSHSRMDTTTAVTAGATAMSAIIESATDSSPSLLSSTAHSRSLSSVLPRRQQEAALMEAPSLGLVLLAFILNAERACTPQQLTQWVHTGGLLSVIACAVSAVEHVKSALIDTPTTVDGSLSEEVYLAGAMRAVRTDTVTVAVLSCKLLAALLVGHGDTLQQLLATEMAALVHKMTPLLAQVAIQNPTVTSSAAAADGGAAVSPLYYSPSGRGGGAFPGRSPSAAGGVRSSRYTPLGECALAAFDACLSLNRTARLRCLDVNVILPALPNLFRCTKRSIHAPLRGAVYRALSHMCATPAILSMVLDEMPSMVAAAVGSVLAFRADAPQHWEGVAAAAEWLCRVLQLSTPAPGAGEELQNTRLRLRQSALPQRLVHLTATAPLSFATTALLELCVALHTQEDLARQDGEGRDIEEAERYDDGTRSVLAPLGRRSLSCWTHFLQQATRANEKLAKLARHPIWQLHRSSARGEGNSLAPPHAAALTSNTTKDAMARADGARENITVQYAFTAATLRCLVALLTSFPEYRTHFSHEVVYSVMGAALAVPCPSRVCAMLSARFNVPVEPDAALTHAYDHVVQWVCELAPVWFQATAGTEATLSTSPTAHAARVLAAADFPPMPAAVLESAATVMSDDTVPQRTRCHIPLFISSVLLLPVRSYPPSPAAVVANEPVLLSSVASVAGRLFTASLRVKRLTCVSGMQCRLLALFSSANAEAVRCGWFAGRAQDLAKLVKVLVRNGGVLDAQDTESFLVTLSLVSSVVSHARCPSLPRNLRHDLCAAVAEGVRYPHVRLPTLKALRAMARSAEGRRCLLHEVAMSGEPLARSCFGRVLGLALGIPTALGGSGATASSSALSPPQRDGKRLHRKANAFEAVREALDQAAVDTSFAILTAVCGSCDETHSENAAHDAVGEDAEEDAAGCGSRPFVAAFVRYRGMDVLEKLMRSHDQNQRGRPSPAPSPSRLMHTDGSGSGEGAPCTIPLPLLRLVAALSFASDAQRSIVQHTTLFTILVELAGQASPHGSIALLVLRNVSFHPMLKTALCQDTRVMLTLKSALMGLPSVEMLVLDPALVFSTAGSGGSRPSPGRAGEAHGFTRSKRARNTPSAWSVLRPDIVESNNGALTDWATRVSCRFYQAYMRSTAPPPSSASPPPREGGNAGGGGGGGGGERAQPTASPHHRAIAAAQRTARSASPLAPANPPIVTLHDLVERDVDLVEEQQGRTTEARVSGDGVFHEGFQATMAMTATNPHRWSVMCDTTASCPAEVFRRQELAVAALWSLLHDHQRGKAYVKRLLAEAPAVAVEKLFSRTALADAKGDEDGRASDGFTDSSARSRAKGKREHEGAPAQRSVDHRHAPTEGFVPSFWSQTPAEPTSNVHSAAATNCTAEPGSTKSSATTRAQPLADGVRSIQLLTT